MNKRWQELKFTPWPFAAVSAGRLETAVLLSRFKTCPPRLHRFAGCVSTDQKVCAAKHNFDSSYKGVRLGNNSYRRKTGSVSTNPARLKM